MKEGTKNKRSFAGALFEILSEIAVGADSLLVRESMQRKYLRMGGFNPDNVYRGFRNLENRGLLRNVGKNYKLTSKGQKWYASSKFSKLSIRPKAWDKKWRVIIFDIPEDFSRKRHLFRRKIRSLDFYMLQKSVFVYPFDCQEELGFIGSYLGVGEYVDLIIADSVGFKERVIKEYYGL